jgi:hypothetical protein
MDINMDINTAPQYEQNEQFINRIVYPLAPEDIQDNMNQDNMNQYINQDINQGINRGDIENILSSLRGNYDIPATEQARIPEQEILNGTVVIINRGVGPDGVAGGIECEITGYNRTTGQYSLINNVTKGVVGSMTKDQFRIKGVKTMEEWVKDAKITMGFLTAGEIDDAYEDYLRMQGGSNRSRPKRRKTQKRRTQKRKTTKRKTTKKKKKTRKKKKRSTKRKRR